MKNKIKDINEYISKLATEHADEFRLGNLEDPYEYVEVVGLGQIIRDCNIDLKSLKFWAKESEYWEMFENDTDDILTRCYMCLEREVLEEMGERLEMMRM